MDAALDGAAQQGCAFRIVLAYRSPFDAANGRNQPPLNACRICTSSVGRSGVAPGQAPIEALPRLARIARDVDRWRSVGTRARPDIEPHVPSNVVRRRFRKRQQGCRVEAAQQGLARDLPPRSRKTAATPGSRSRVSMIIRCIEPRAPRSAGSAACRRRCARPRSVLRDGVAGEADAERTESIEVVMNDLLAASCWHPTGTPESRLLQ
jgi:hypothetical protein